MDNKYEERLGTASMLPLILKMALPGFAAQLINLLYSIVDRVFIGHIELIGTDALAGIGVTSSIIILISAFSQIVGGGGAPLASIALGKGDRERAHRILGNGFSLLVLFAVVTSGITYIFMEPLLRLIGASDATIGYATDYLSVYLTGTLFVMFATGLNSFINAQGRPGISMIAVIIGAILNIGLDPLFIYVFGMGVTGAALATVISQAVSAFIIVGFLVSDKVTLKIKPKYLKLDIKNNRLAVCSWHRPVYNGKYGKSCRLRSQRLAERIRRYIRQHPYGNAERNAVCRRAFERLCAGLCSDSQLQLRQGQHRPCPPLL